MKHIQWENQYANKVLEDIEKNKTLKPEYHSKKRSGSIDLGVTKRNTPRKKVVEIVDVRFNKSSHAAQVHEEVSRIDPN